MDLDGIAFDRRFGHPVVKDGCGVFGMLRKAGAPTHSQQCRDQRDILHKVPGERPRRRVRRLQDPSDEPGTAPYRIQAFVTDRERREPDQGRARGAASGRSMARRSGGSTRGGATSWSGRRT